MALPSLEHMSRDRSASTGDPEHAVHERKRPRLDMSPNDGRISTSTQGVQKMVQESENSSTVASNLDHPHRASTPPITSIHENTSQSTLSPTSKVTINTRPLSAQSIVHDVTLTEGEKGVHAEVSEKSAVTSTSLMLDTPPDTTPAKTSPGGADQPISIPSSRSESPTIKLSGAEEIDTPARSPLSSVPQEETNNEEVPVSNLPIWFEFPFQNPNAQEDIVDLVKSIAQVLERGDDDSQFTALLRGMTPFLLSLPRLLRGRDFASLRMDIEFFQTLPMLISSLFKRRAPIPVGVDDNDLIQFLKGYALFSIAIVEVDIGRLRSLSDSTAITDPPWLFSSQYLQRLTFMLQLSSTYNFHTALRTSRHVNWSDFSARLSVAFLAGNLDKPFDLLSSLLHELARAVPPSSQLRTIVLAVVELYRTLLSTVNLHKVPTTQQQRDSLRKDTYKFVTKAHDVLQEAITKQHSWLTIENNGECLQTYTYLTRVTVMLFPDIAGEVFKMANTSQDAVDPDEIVELAGLAFRLALLKTLIQQGRMELRVWATETMAQELVNIWTSIQRLPLGRSQPMLKLVIDFLGNNRIVRYILGVDSHPQIVSRSFNVIGFLCVSNNWHPEDSDIAWRAILESHDHRSVSAVVDVLKQNLQHLNLDASLYIYEKLHGVPAEKLDNRMLDFIMTLLNYTTQKFGRSNEHEHTVNLTMVKLCLHLLKEVNVPARCSAEISNQVRDEISNFMVTNQPSSTGSWYLDMSEEEKTSIWGDICNNIASHNNHATGSVIAMKTILHSLDRLAAGEFVAKTDYTRILLEDMVRLSEQHARGEGVSDEVLLIQCTVRLDCMFHLVCQIPQSFDQGMNESLWHNVLTAALPPKVRSYAWTMIANAYRNSASSNDILEYVASQFMQRLTPMSFDAAVLDFALASVEFDIRTNFGRSGEVDQCLEMPSMERLWRIMLEAPDGTVEAQASNLIIKLYLDKTLIGRSSAASVEKSQATLVDRCIRTVIESAQQLGPANTFTDVDANHKNDYRIQKGESNSYETRLHRSLMLLRNFLDTLKTRPQLKIAPSQIIGPALKTFQQRGTAVALRLRILDHPEIRAETVTWNVGEDNTGHEIWQFLTGTTGWSQINFIISGGRMQIHDSQSTVQELKIGQAPVIVSKAIGSTETGISRTIRSTSPVDSKIMHHFGELYALLESHERIAKAIYEFLTMFSSQEDIVIKIKSRSLSASSLLPVDKPFKLLYYATALRSCIEEESYSSEPNVEFLQYTVQTIILALSHIQAIHEESQLFVDILHGLVETLLLALRAKVPQITSSTYFSDPALFIDNLLQSWKSVRSVTIEGADRAVKRILSRNFFDVLIESVLHDPRLWQYIDEHNEFDQSLAFTILFNADQDGRKCIRDVILRLAGTSIGKTNPKSEDVRSPRGRFSSTSIDDCLSHLWSHIYPLIPNACEAAVTCQEFLEAAVATFGTVCKKANVENLVDCFAEIKSLLLKHHETSRSGICATEYLPQGLAKILHSCIINLNHANVAVPDSIALIRDIYKQFLFPALSESVDASLASQKAPMIDTNTRTALYDVIVALCQSEESLTIISEEIAESAVDRDAFVYYSSNERKALKSDQGYAGLRNLSNTCYLNSLFSQLFMNIKFREFILGINISNEDNQKTIVELANVFANMQSSYEKYVSPEEAVESITQYTGEQIDVTVQMDVDEFFNLLFDRLEAQITDSHTREVFKSIYGGQLVQQIKSQECEHISERLEPFSAVQIEIKGKSGLEEGLAAYVEGEVLQGENKYSCTGCGRHVNAVKRACLKEVPDNLIFNLKRFDYDIMTGMRCKVNDEFQFPEKIDMMPYTMEALSEPDHKLPSDVFELVGVIIHSGTAETGHYYSYIQQRPSARSSEESWVQFNDHDVSKFEPSQMKDMAFGGNDQTFNALSKFYNGYMLFYQRASSIEGYAQDYPTFNEGNQIEVSLPRAVDNRIAQENEICFRRYVAQDPSHAKFMRQILERMRCGEQSCSSTHSLEDQLIPIVLEYIQQVSSRWKEAPEFEETIKLLCGYVKDCSKCALNVVEWFQADENLMSCILRAWYTQARKQFASLLVTCYAVLCPMRHATKKEDGTPSERRDRLEEAFAGCLKQIYRNWTMVQRWNRGWEQLFGFLLAVAQMSPREAHALIEIGFLERCAEVIWIHNSPNSKATPKILRVRYNVYLAAKEKGRIFHHISVVDLFAELLKYVVLDDDRSAVNRPALNLNDNESDLLGLSPAGSFVWLKKLIAGRNSDAAVEIVVQELCRYPAFLEKTADMLLNGLLSTKTSVQVAFLFLAPCQHYVRYCSDAEMVSDMVKRSLHAITDSDGLLSSCFLDYVKELLAMQNTVSECSHQHVMQIIVNGIARWAPPLLMAPNDVHRDVRTETLTFLDEILFMPMLQLSDVEDTQLRNAHVEIVRSLVCESITYLNNNFLSTHSGGQQRNVLFVGQASQMIRVLEHCETYFDTDNEEDEQLVALMAATTEELRLLEANVDTEDLEGWREPSSDQLSDQSFEMSVTP